MHDAIASKPFLNIEKLKTGDAESFQRLHQLFYKDLVKKAISLLDEKEEATALVNHSFIKCWLRSEALTSMDYVSAFLFTTVRNQCTAFNQGDRFDFSQCSRVLKAILSDAARNGLTRKELFSRLNTLQATELSNARAIFRQYYDRRLEVTHTAKETGQESKNAGIELNTAFQVLHLILSVENI